MTNQEKFKFIKKILKVSTVCGSGVLFIGYHIRETCRAVDKIVNRNVIDKENKHTPEYIYIDDPAYNFNLEKEKDQVPQYTIGVTRIWKSLKHSLAWRLLWLCRHGSKEQRNIALEQLASFRSNKEWTCLKLAQALDKDTAVLLARTRGSDLRYFLPPPIHVRRAALTKELLSFKLRDMILAVNAINPHSCVQHFLSKHFANVQEQAVEVDIILTKPDTISERDLCMICLDVIHHHLNLFYNSIYEEDTSALTLIKMGILPRLAECFLRNPNDLELDLVILKILTVLSIHTTLLKDFFQNGLIKELCRLLRSSDVRLSSSAAVCLENLSGEHCYRPGLYLLHPIYRTTTPTSCDTLLVHGLRGGVFVTWRQRDKKCAEPIGFVDATISDNNCNDPSQAENYMDPELQQVVEDLIEFEDESLLSDLEIVLHDLPIEARRENICNSKYIANKKRNALKEELQDQSSYTFCWPKDWLPNDCNNLRILGVNYWSSLSDWLDRCPMQTADIETRAADLAPDLIEAGVGSKNTPVVWLAHSMGGLIVKQILIESSQSKENMLSKLSENTKAVLFFSTPHKGSALATMPRAAAAILWPSTDVRQLQENSPVLLELHKNFIKYADLYNWETISFAETMPTLVTAFKVPIHFVESFSADLGRGVFYQLPLDHLSICKPATRQSILYTIVLDVLQRVTAEKINLKESYTLTEKVLDLLKSSVKKKAQDVIQLIDETHTNDGLFWFEKILLDAFTDFTD